jgi:uncharacterized membrane protein (UPF0127 family)
MEVIVGNQRFNGEYLTKPEEIQKGMMGRNQLDGCMVFKLNHGHHSFWMKDCLIPLDIVFINKNRISKIHHNCPPADPHSMNPPKYTGIGDHVIEFPGGTCSNMKIGDRVNLYLGSPQNPVGQNRI